MVRSAVERIRAEERNIMKLCIRYAKMPRKEFIKAFPGNETDLKWTGKLVKSKADWAQGIVNQEVEIVRAQRKLAQVEEESGLTIWPSKISTAADHWRSHGAPRQERNG